MSRALALAFALFLFACLAPRPPAEPRYFSPGGASAAVVAPVRETHTGAELDYVEEKNGTLFGFEFKSGSKIVKGPVGWLKAYPESKFQCINKNNYLDFILG